MAGEGLEVSVRVEHLDPGSDGNCADQAVDQLSDGFAARAARPIHRCGRLVVGGCRRQRGRSCEEASELEELSFVACTCEEFHRDRVTDGNVVGEQAVD